VERFTIPVPGASQNKLIQDLSFCDDVEKTLRTINHNYSNRPYFTQVYPLIESILRYEDRSIGALCLKSFQDILLYLDIDKQFLKASTLDYDRSLPAKERLIHLSHKFGADCYINTPGGRELYNKPDFAKEAVDLRFIDSLPIEYDQGVEDFVPNLSIIDVLMNCSIDQIRELLIKYKLS